MHGLVRAEGPQLLKTGRWKPLYRTIARETLRPFNEVAQVHKVLSRLIMTDIPLYISLSSFLSSFLSSGELGTLEYIGQLHADVSQLGLLTTPLVTGFHYPLAKVQVSPRVP
jgi:hypothetical protein